MRTTLNIDDELIKEAKIAAIREGITLTEYIERALRQCRKEKKRVVDERRFSASAKTAPWKPLTFKGQPDPDFPWTGSYSKLLEYVEGPDARP